MAWKLVAAMAAHSSCLVLVALGRGDTAGHDTIKQMGQSFPSLM